MFRSRILSFAAAVVVVVAIVYFAEPYIWTRQSAASAVTAGTGATSVTIGNQRNPCRIDRSWADHYWFGYAMN